SNAGHTLVVDGAKIVTHLIPSGVMRPGVTCVLGDGMVIDPQTLLAEIAELKARGLLADDRDLVLGAGEHIVLPYHRALDALSAQTAAAPGTTRRGIGPAYECKVARRGIRVADLVRPDRLAALIDRALTEINPLLEQLGGKRHETATLLPLCV